MNHITHWIDGKPWMGEPKRRGMVFDPATGCQTGEVDLAGTAEVDEAVAAAGRAFPDGGPLRWPRAPQPCSPCGRCWQTVWTTWLPW